MEEGETMEGEWGAWHALLLVNLVKQVNQSMIGGMALEMLAQEEVDAGLEDEPCAEHIILTTMPYRAT
jgi:hypothetical protein